MDKLTLCKLKQDVKLALNDNPGLTVTYLGDKPKYLEGIYSVVDDLGAVQEQYDIKIEVPDNYPYGFPKLQEISKKIPRTEDRHMNDKGYACVELTHRTILIARNGISLHEFLKRYVHRYFCWQLVYEIDSGNSNLQEWAHGLEAIYDFYKELLGTDSCIDIIGLLRSAFNNPRPSLNNQCPCNSGKLFKRCHALTYQVLLCLGKAQLKLDILVLEKLLEDKNAA